MTVNQAIAKIQLDFPNASSAELLDDIQVIHDELCFDFKLVKSTVTNTSLVAGTRSYNLASGAVRVYQVRYVRSATDGDFRVLHETSEDELDTVQRNWRGLADGEPVKFFADSGQIHLVPAPDTSTSGSYPQLQYEVASSATLTGTDNLPSGLSSQEAWVAGVKARVALRYEDKRYPIYERAYAIERRRLATQVNNLPARYQQVFRPSPYQGTRKV
jgi:hypothetical protein